MISINLTMMYTICGVVILCNRIIILRDDYVDFNFQCVRIFVCITSRCLTIILQNMLN